MSDERLVAEYGSDEQRRLYADGGLDREQVADLARSVFLSPLDGLPRFRRLGHHDLPHEPDCAGTVASYGTRPASVVRASSWRSIYAAMLSVGRHGVAHRLGAKVDFDVVEHYGSCDMCRRGEAMRLSMVVRVIWQDRVLSREYAL